MKKIVEESGEGLVACLGETVLVWCANYIYSGRLEGISDHDIKLSSAVMVFCTGSFKDDGFETSEELPGGVHYVRTCAIESYCVIS